jgi:cell division protease FtsH
LSRTLRHLLIWVLTVGVLLLGWKFVTMNMNTAAHDAAISLSQMQNDIDAGKVQGITVNGSEVTGTYKDGKGIFHTVVPQGFMDQAELRELTEHGVNVTVDDPSGSAWLCVLMQLLPMILVLILVPLLVLYMLRRERRRSQNRGVGQAPGAGV